MRTHRFSPGTRKVMGTLASAGAALALVTGVAGPAAAQTAPPGAIDITQKACPTDKVSTGTFGDVNSSNSAALAINCIADYGVTTGNASGGFNPTGTVTRAQMALFLSRLGDNFDKSPAGFTDIGGLSPEAQDAINGLYNAGVVNGTSGTKYSPSNGVSRAQMAAFINRLEGAFENGQPFTTSNDYFTDDNGLSADAQRDINGITSVGIATGTGGGKYSPTATVSRQQMASFLARDLEVSIRAGKSQSVYG